MRGEKVVEILQHPCLLGRVRFDIVQCGPAPLGHRVELAVEDLAGIARRPSQPSGPLLLLGLERLEQHL